MLRISIFTLVMLANCIAAQTGSDKMPTQRKGFVIGLGLGAGVLALDAHDTTQVRFSTTLPNIKIGYMLHPRFALLALLPGANYKYKGKDRGFEGLVLAGQYWLKDNWWVMGGTGLTFDAPAFYTVSDSKKADFYTGIPALTGATGYEIWHKGRFALDLQYRLFFGKSTLSNSRYRTGVSNMVIIGFNWY